MSLHIYPGMAMSTPDRRHHWQNVYLSKGEQEVSWTQPDPEPSLGLIEKYAPSRNSSIVDIGGGASRLVDALAERGYEDLTVLDLSEAALTTAQQRLGGRVAGVQWIAADVIKWQPSHLFDLWHDRAAFHFLVEPDDRRAYIDRLGQSVKAGGHAIIATFSLDGPEKCSGLPVQRYDPTSLSETLGPGFELIAHQPHRHVTPWGAVQSFQFSVLQCR
jgi:2-polyprenyl-3-methyl-5-hydroxy-6-metoxy-1,4-benzoquinol methylase